MPCPTLILVLILVPTQTQNLMLMQCLIPQRIRYRRRPTILILRPARLRRSVPSSTSVFAIGLEVVWFVSFWRWR